MKEEDYGISGKASAWKAFLAVWAFYAEADGTNWLLGNENNRLRDALQAQEMILHEIRDAISGMQRINEDSCRSLNEMQHAQIAERAKDDIRFWAQYRLPNETD